MIKLKPLSRDGVPRRSWLRCLALVLILGLATACACQSSWFRSCDSPGGEPGGTLPGGNVAPALAVAQPVVAALPPKVPASCAELYAAAERPFQEAMGVISLADSKLVETCFSKLYPNFGFGYMHSSDHYAALKVILGREPSFREVYDSYHLGGSKNIDAARVKMGGGERPSGWDQWTPEQKRYGVLVHIHGISRGSRIADGKIKDPSPDRTRELMLLWGSTTELPPDPAKPPTPDSPTTPSGALSVQGELRLVIQGQARVFTLTERKEGT